MLVDHLAVLLLICEISCEATELVLLRKTLEFFLGLQTLVVKRRSLIRSIQTIDLVVKLLLVWIAIEVNRLITRVLLNLRLVIIDNVWFNPRIQLELIKTIVSVLSAVHLLLLIHLTLFKLTYHLIFIISLIM